jgi:hypothetical protein
VARYQLINPNAFVIQPWLVLTLDLLIVVAIFTETPARSGTHDTGALGGIYVVLIVAGALAISRQLPLALALGVSRRSYYAGTALLSIATAAVYGLALTVLQLIERATGGWGIDLHFFRVPYLLSGPWYLPWLTSFVGLALMLAWGLTGLLAALTVLLLAGGYATIRRATV